MKTRYTTLLGLTSLLYLTGCGGGTSHPPAASPTPPPVSQSFTLAGSVVKGPIQQAIINLYNIDPSKANLMGAKVATGTTNDQSLFTDLALTRPLDAGYIVEVSLTEASIDLSTGQAPYLTRLYSVISKTDIENQRFTAVTPFTAMALSLVNKPGESLIVADIIRQASQSQALLLNEFGFGIDADPVDIFHTPAAIFNDHPQPLSAVVQYRATIEGFAAVVQYVSEKTGHQPDELMLAFAHDLHDGALDGVGSNLPGYGDIDINTLLDGAPIAY